MAAANTSNVFLKPFRHWPSVGFQSIGTKTRDRNGWSASACVHFEVCGLLCLQQFLEVLKYEKWARSTIVIVRLV